MKWPARDTQYLPLFTTLAQSATSRQPRWPTPTAQSGFLFKFKYRDVLIPPSRMHLSQPYFNTTTRLFDHLTCPFAGVTVSTAINRAVRYCFVFYLDTFICINRLENVFKILSEAINVIVLQ